MKKGLIFLLIAAWLISKPYAVLAANDWEYWSAYEAKIKLSEKVDLKVKPEFRYKDDMSEHYYSHIDLGFEYKASKRWVLGAYYRYIDELKTTGWKYEHRPHLNAEYLWKWSNFSFGNRARFEFRDPEGRDNNSIRYVNKFTIKAPKLTKLQIQPYVASEPFYDFDLDEWTRVRTYAGFGLQLAKNINAEFYLIHESNKGTKDWSGKNILGSALKWQF